MKRLHPGAVVIISWEADCSPQMMTAITSSPDPSWNPQTKIMVNENTPVSGTD
jgi:hypothetical protein